MQQNNLPGTAVSALLFALALAVALVGLRWSLPGREKADKVLPERWRTPAFYDALSAGWEDIFEKSRGTTPLLAETSGKYTAHLKGRFQVDRWGDRPPDWLMNSYRSMLIRSGHPDEAVQISILSRMKPAQLDFRPNTFIYGGGYLYPLGAYYFLLSKLGAIERLPLRQLLEKPQAFAAFFASGRLLSALAFAGICCLCLLLASSLAGPAAGLFSFALALCSPLLLVQAHYMTPHIWAAFWGVLSAAALYAGLERPGYKYTLFSGACLGVAAGSYLSLLQASVFLAALLTAARPFRPKEALLRAAAGAGTAALFFVLVNPYLPGNLGAMAEEMKNGPLPSFTISYLGNLYALTFKNLPAALGVPGTLALFCGYAYGARSEKPALRALTLACILVFFAAAKMVPADFPAGLRRFLVWLALSAVPAGAFLQALAERFPRRLRPAFAAAALLPGALLVSAYAVNFSRAAGPGSTYSRTGAWLDAAAPGGSLGLLEFPQPSSSPYFRFDRWPLLLATPAVMAALPAAELPASLLVTSQQKNNVAGLLDREYSLAAGFYPEKILGFAVDESVSAMNPSTEIYRLKKDERKNGK